MEQLTLEQRRFELHKRMDEADPETRNLVCKVISLLSKYDTYMEYYEHIGLYDQKDLYAQKKKELMEWITIAASNSSKSDI